METIKDNSAPSFESVKLLDGFSTLRRVFEGREASGFNVLINPKLFTEVQSFANQRPLEGDVENIVSWLEKLSDVLESIDNYDQGRSFDDSIDSLHELSRALGIIGEGLIGVSEYCKSKNPEPGLIEAVVLLEEKIKTILADRLDFLDRRIGALEDYLNVR